VTAHLVHPHTLRHACGYKLANDGQDTRALQPEISPAAATTDRKRRY